MNHSIEYILQEQLNSAQKEAVLLSHGPILIIAGAGSGKTRVITTKIAYLLEVLNVQPYEIIALTFTNKAAREMKDRVSSIISSGKLPFIGTFHAYCLLALKRFYHDTTFTILDSDDQEKLIKTILERYNLNKDLSPKNIAHNFSILRNKHTFEELQIPELWLNEQYFKIYVAYEIEKKSCNYFDFDDLLIKTVSLLQVDQVFKQILCKPIKYILVDEYQDTNFIQNILLKLLACDGKLLRINSLCVVGDEDQSIYSWRGATVENIRAFSKDFPNTQVIKIEQNYRSDQQILDIAHDLISHNSVRTPKRLWSTKKGINRAISVVCNSEYQEAELIAASIIAYKKRNPLNTIAILYRTHFQSRPIEEVCIGYNIPYKIIGGMQFYERAEIKDIIAYLKLIANPFDRIAFLRVINTPNRGLGQKCIELFKDILAIESFLNFYELIEKIIVQQKLPNTKLHTLSHFISIFTGLNGQQAPTKVLEAIIKRTLYYDYLHATYDEENAKDRIANIKELMNAAKHLEETGIVTLVQFLEELALMTDVIKNKEESGNVIFLMTLHAAKGLEFDLVCIAGIEEQMIPTPRSLDNSESLEEERRLLYVGITRAKEFLLLSSTKMRYVYGSPTRQAQSRFLSEISQNLISMFDISLWSTQSIMPFIDGWFCERLPLQSMKNTSFSFPSIQSNQSIQKNIMQSSSSIQQDSIFKKNQHVKHKKYGLGTIICCENKNNQCYAQVRFISGLKKIAIDFLEKI